jgi:hypothetical protein
MTFIPVTRTTVPDDKARVDSDGKDNVEECGGEDSKVTVWDPYVSGNTIAF